MTEQSTEIDKPIVAKAGEYYMRMRYFVALLLVAFGLYFAYDGWIGYPTLNAKHDEVELQKKQAEDRHDDKQAAELFERLKDIKFHSDLAILLQKILAFALPAVGLGLVMWAKHNARGEIVLTADTLTAPGHPAIHLDQIVALDQRLWDKKDIAFVEYEVPPARGKIRLDAFVYQTDPIVKIHDRIEALLKEDAVPTVSNIQEESPPS